MGATLWQFHRAATVHVQEPSKLGNCHRVAPKGPTPVVNMSIHVSHMKCNLVAVINDKTALWVTAKNVETGETTVSQLELLLRILSTINKLYL